MYAVSKHMSWGTVCQSSCFETRLMDHQLGLYQSKLIASARQKYQSNIMFLPLRVHAVCTLTSYLHLHVACFIGSRPCTSSHAAHATHAL